MFVNRALDMEVDTASAMHLPVLDGMAVRYDEQEVSMNRHSHSWSQQDAGTSTDRQSYKQSCDDRSMYNSCRQQGHERDIPPASYHLQRQAHPQQTNHRVSHPKPTQGLHTSDTSKTTQMPPLGSKWMPPAHLWPSVTCKEFGGLGWGVVVLRRYPRTKLVEVMYSYNADVEPTKGRLHVSQLTPIPRSAAGDELLNTSASGEAACNAMQQCRPPPAHISSQL